MACASSHVPVPFREVDSGTASGMLITGMNKTQNIPVHSSLIIQAYTFMHSTKPGIFS